MNGSVLSQVISVLIPLLLHMAVSDVISVLFGGSMDSALCTTVTALLVIPVAAWMYSGDWKKAKEKELRNDFWSFQDKVAFGIVCFLGGGLLNLIWSGILNLLGIQNAFSNSTQEALLAGQIAVQLAGLGILVPVAEELIFRVLIYGRMKRFLAVIPAAVLSSLLFAVYHGNPIQMIFAFPMAMALTAVFEKGKLFVYPVLFHMGANLLAVLLNFFL
ncbi:MAG: type II CAAX endopeptidase family protein [Candidatus Choladocola sp.]|nr:type II CAAX endopeptidase family protein [Candidatus Choladocola sp.]